MSETRDFISGKRVKFGMFNSKSTIANHPQMGVVKTCDQFLNHGTTCPCLIFGTGKTMHFMLVCKLVIASVSHCMLLKDWKYLTCTCTCTCTCMLMDWKESTVSVHPHY